MLSWLLLIHLLQCAQIVVESAGVLYPRDSETRETLSLNGLWDFVLTPFNDPLRGHSEKWYNYNWNVLEDLDVHLMPVPSSYNDLTTDWTLRDHVGLVWYQREFFVPKSWNDQRVWLRFSSVCYAAEVWVNGEWVMAHVIGHLPFQAEITSLLKFDQVNTITVSVDNTLLESTIPQGSLEELVSGRTKQTYTFDFFNYAGIDRPVTLYTTPKTYIDDITVNTQINDPTGVVKYEISVVGTDQVTTQVTLIDKSGAAVAAGSSTEGSLTVPDANLWWPLYMDPNPGYLYSLQVDLLSTSGSLLDRYRQLVGIRTVTWNASSLMVNNRPVYLRGFGRHEDSDIRGKGLDLPLIIRDHNLIKWIGANSYRTSHYPYAEEIMDLADQLGIMIIDECPAVNTKEFKDELLLNHKQSLTELMLRDKNRPSVIMWSAANEPDSQVAASENYYRDVVAHMKSLDETRPVTIVIAQAPQDDHAAQFVDVVSYNLYEAWYEDAGDLDVVTSKVLAWARDWHELHPKPLMCTEYGGDTLEGLHLLPNYIWSEDYQVKLMSKHFEAFDQLRSEGYFVGEMIWNFADFKTAQTYTRVGGNKKGIFTRNRQPKASAHFLRKRYWTIAQALDGAEALGDLDDYVISSQ